MNTCRFSTKIICVFYCPQPGKTHIGLENAPNPQDIGKSARTSKDWFFSFLLFLLYISLATPPPPPPSLTKTSLKLTPTVGPCCSLGRLLKKYVQIQHNKAETPKWQEPTSLLFTSVAGDLNSGLPRTNPASDQSGIRTRDCWIANPTRWPLDPAASSQELLLSVRWHLSKAGRSKCYSHRCSFKGERIYFISLLLMLLLIHVESLSGRQVDWRCS